MVRRSNYSSTVDAGYGLIYRLNDLWNGADRAALVGDLDKWNHILNAIFRNLCYRGVMEIVYKEDENSDAKFITPVIKNNPRIKKKIHPSASIKTIELNNEDSLVFNKFRELIRTIKTKIYKAIKDKRRNDYNLNQEDYSDILAKKDIWLRKFMQDRGLYLKEVEFDPSQAMWGG